MKLHELLAIEGSLETQATKVRTDLMGTFDKKRHHFEEKRTTFTPSGEGQQAVTEAMLDIQTTVQKELAWIQPHLRKALDASFRVAVTNQFAVADIRLEDGTVIASGIPATALLELEKRMAEIHALVLTIPTLDPAKGFIPDIQRGGGIYIAREVNKTRTKKIQKPVVLYDATKEHPAQVQLVGEDIPVGNIQEQEWSGLITPAEKAELIDRTEQVARAVRQARSRANEAEVDTSRGVADALLNRIFRP
jgi:hypothetical protein